MERRPSVFVEGEPKHIESLYGLAEHYHKLCTCYKWKHKRYCKIDSRLSKISGVLTSVGVIVGVSTANVIVLASLSGAGMLLSTIVKVGKYEKKAEACDTAYKEYKKILTRIKKAINDGDSNKGDYNEILTIACHTDDMVAENCPTVNGEGKRYDKEFGSTDIREIIPRFSKLIRSKTSGMDSSCTSTPRGHEVSTLGYTSAQTQISSHHGQALYSSSPGRICSSPLSPYVG